MSLPGLELGGSLDPADISWARFLGSGSGRGLWPLPCYYLAETEQNKIRPSIAHYNVNMDTMGTLRVAIAQKVTYVFKLV